MDAAETARLLDDIAAVTRAMVEQVTAPFADRLSAVERRFAEMPAPRDGKDADPDAVAALIAARLDPDLLAMRSALDEVKKQAAAIEAITEVAVARHLVAAVEAMPKPVDGKDAEPDVVAEIVRASIAPDLSVMQAQLAEMKAEVAAIPGLAEAAFAAIPKPADGKSVTLDDIQPMIAAAVAEEVAKIPPAKNGEDGEPGAPGEDGKSVDIDEVRALVTEAVAAIPKPQDGRSVSADDVRPLIDEAVAKAFAALPVPKDGVGLAGALIDRGGNLVVTLTDGSTRELGRVEGKDGAPGENGSHGAAGADGAAGRDGIDGLSIEDLSLDYDGERAVVVRFHRGDVRKEFTLTLPIPIYRGVFDKAAAYVRGDVVTYAGSTFIANEDAPEGQPESSKGWKLSVKRGRDGKEAVAVPRDPNATVKIGGEK